MPSRRAFVLAAFAALGLAGCGRKGPLELPADVQAERNARQAAEQANAPKNGQKLSEEGGPAKPPPPQLGDPGRRPPALYPFPLDPLL
ncbi:MAG TPA: lipoprotein [Methylocystis sp.]|nr:lipoprotein [Methylocystis sp.]